MALRFRTDRHNNPTALSSAVAKQARLHYGCEYTNGDSFGRGNSTARLIGSAISLTIKVIDNIGFWTARGLPRWIYISTITAEIMTGLTPSQYRKVFTFAWSLLTKRQKTRVIEKMYRYEGGDEMDDLFKGLKS